MRPPGRQGAFAPDAERRSSTSEPARRTWSTYLARSFSSRTGREPRYHIAIHELQDWTYLGEPLVPLKGFPGVVWERTEPGRSGAGLPARSDCALVRRYWSQVLLGEFAKRVGNGTDNAQRHRAVADRLPSRSDRGSCRRRDRPRSAPGLCRVPGRRSSSSSPSGSSSCSVACLPRDATRRSPAARCVFSSG
mgnify:CR=1 FL=1